MPDSILITGATGMLGRRTMARLAPRRQIFALVRKRPSENLPGDVVAIMSDLKNRDELQLPEVPATILHLAQSTHYHAFPDRALDVFEVNVGSTQRLLDFAWRRGVKRFVYASSGGVYGHGEHPFTEAAHYNSDVSHYLAGKQYCELLAKAYAGQLIVVILRFFFIYGPGQRDGMLVPRLVDNVKRGHPILLQGKDGLRTNPIFVDDAAAAVEAASRLKTSETINIAGPEVLSLREIGTLIGEATGRAPCFEMQVNAEPKSIIGDTAKMARLLGPAKTSFAEGIRCVVAANRGETSL
jgi:UDP-glucose 4-epimerase